MTILKKIADACTKEATSWQSNIQALHKAKQEEQKAVEKAKEKELKLREKEAEREKSRKEKAEQKLRKEAEAAEAQSTVAASTQAVAGKKRRRTVGVDELTNEDPQILREMSRFSGGSLPFLEELQDFARGISHAPLHVLGCRLKRSCVKRALQVFWLQVNRF